MNEKICGIYKITSPSGRIYIGQGINIKRRESAYKNLDCKAQPRLYNSLLKYGWVNHTFEIIEECNIIQLNERERYYQDFYDVLSKQGLNCVLTGTKDKSGVSSLKGTKRDPEIVARITATKKSLPGPMLGKTHTDEAKKKISEAALGRPAHENTKRRAKEFHTGRKRSEETCKKIGDAHRGKKATPEQIEYRLNNPGINAKKVINIKTLEIFASSSIVSRLLGWPDPKLSKYLKGSRVNYTDYVYLEDYEKGIRPFTEKVPLKSYINAKKIINIDTNEIYESIKIACNIYNIKESTLRSYLDGRRINKTRLQWITNA